MIKRAQNILRKTRYNEQTHPVIAALVAFAAQNPGLDYGNYGDPVSYRQESRSITHDWERFQFALFAADRDGVTDADVVKAAPNAFSGRLEWWNRCTWCNHCRKIVNAHAHNTTCPECVKCDGVVHHEPHWEYTTGQYFPTEYRKAAACVLEQALRAVRQARPPVTKSKIVSIADLKQLNEQNGGCWFERGTMRFFNTRIESGILQGKYFITSEQREDAPRKFTIRSFDDEGSIDTIGGFHAHDTKAEAIAALREIGQPVTA